MGRRREPVEVVAAREVLRGRFAEQEAAVVRFFDTGARVAALRSSLEDVEREQCRHAGALVELVGVRAAVELTGWSRSRVLATQRSRRSGSRDGLSDGSVAAAGVGALGAVGS